MTAGRVLWVDHATKSATLRTVGEIPEVLGDRSGWLWLDVPEPDAETAALLTDVFGFHAVALQDALERNHVPDFMSMARRSSWFCTVPRRVTMGTFTYSWTDAPELSTGNRPIAGCRSWLPTASKLRCPSAAWQTRTKWPAVRAD